MKETIDQKDETATIVYDRNKKARAKGKSLV
jgi:hypothetical protein